MPGGSVRNTLPQRKRERHHSIGDVPELVRAPLAKSGSAQNAS
jgi:hypothetical protein